MKSIAALVILVVSVAGCDSSSLTAVENTPQFSDTDVLGAKPLQVSVNEVSSSGWSGTATFSHDNKNRLFFRITATGDPDTYVRLCVFSNSHGACDPETSRKSGRVSGSYRDSYDNLGSEGAFAILLGNTDTVLAISDPVTFQ